MIITLLTDFGAGSGYPAQMKAAILSRHRDARIVDLSHEVPHFDLLAGALLLEACAPWFPTDAVHCAVVDPGVGTERRAICVVDPEGRRLVGPDNGLFTPFLGEGARVVKLVQTLPLLGPGGEERAISATFHGRDLFAPVAAWLAAGGNADDLGPPVYDPVRLAWPRASRKEDGLYGEVIGVDPFGNLLTAIRAEELPREETRVKVGGRAARFVRTFGDGDPGELLALVGSSGRLEIAVREGNAARTLGVDRGVVVRVRGRW